MTAILPGATIGILGGGQLGRMTAMAARSMGYAVHVLDPDAAPAAAPVADRVIRASFDDADAAAELARHCDVVTLEIEQVSLASIAAAAAFAPVRPGTAVLGVVQDRAAQKQWISQHGFPLGPWRHAETASQLADALGALGASFVKSCRGGYDGRSQLRASSTADAPAAWAALGGRPVVVEASLELQSELSVMVARNSGGHVAVYPAALNQHEQQVLAWSVIPASLEPGVTARGAEIARGIAEAIGLEGILAVELFLTSSGELLVNELAPRPHNSYHASERGLATSQFEQLVRAACDLPLGSVEVVRPAAIVNLFGDLWSDAGDGTFNAPDWSRALAVEDVRLHLYGKRGPRAGRKMGHLSATGRTGDEALARVQRAFAALHLRPLGA
ncbi:MAG: phosphoribosylaminoimidazole carboxylase [Gemmatimonadetes bacterium]|nr:phosphoribosylaminoimidazole carboxylase [Gemmatimonadota bacterium]